LGFSLVKIGPERVAALVKGNIELPSDFDGVVYISIDREDWQAKLGGELQEAGYEMDWNRVEPAGSGAALRDRPANGSEDAGVFGPARVSAEAAAGASEAGSVCRDHRRDPGG
jgi:hypothetical protein